jgi:N,N'-diacetyllegionaminate synthase
MWSDRAFQVPRDPGGSRAIVIGEVALAHDGSLGCAHAHIDAIADAGADAVKFQTHVAAAESTGAEPWRVPFSPQDACRYDYWQRTAFSEPQWHGLQRHAAARGLAFLSSPFSVEAIELLLRVGVAAWKVASGEVANSFLFDRMIESGLPILLSSGMSGWAELDCAAARVIGAGRGLAVLQCTSMYPCPAERVGLNVLPQLRERYGCAVGLSDHSGTIYPGLAAAALGCDVLEVHVTLSREMFGPDVAVSVTTAELRQLVEGLRFVETAMANPVDKDAVAVDLGPMRQLFTRSLTAAADLPAGTVLTREHLTAKKPGTGIPISRLADFVGATLCRPVRADQMLSDADITPSMTHA